MADAWYCKIAGEESGPLPKQELKRMAGDGELLPDDLVRNGDSGAWLPAGRVKDLFGAAAGSSSDSSESRAKPLPKAKPVSRPGGSASSPSTPPKPVRRAVPVDAANTPETPAAAPAAAFDFLENEYAAPTPPVSGGSAKVASAKSATAEAMEKKRADQKKRMLILFGILAGFVLLLGGLLLVLALRGKNEPKPSEPKADLAQAKEKEKEKEGEKQEAGDVWTDASKNGQTLGPITVYVLSAKVEKPSLTDGKSGPQDKLVVHLRLVNNRAENKRIEYTPWNSKPEGAIVEDALKNPSYKLEQFTPRVEGAKDQLTVLDEEPLEDVLVFTKPVPLALAKPLKLTLPGSAIGEKGTLRFTIPSLPHSFTPKPPEPKPVVAEKGKETKTGESGKRGKDATKGKQETKRAASDPGFKDLPRVDPKEAAAAPAAVPAAPPGPAVFGESESKPTGDPKRDFGLDADPAGKGPMGPGDILPEKGIMKTTEEAGKQ